MRPSSSCLTRPAPSSTPFPRSACARFAPATSPVATVEQPLPHLGSPPRAGEERNFRAGKKVQVLFSSAVRLLCGPGALLPAAASQTASARAPPRHGPEICMQEKKKKQKKIKKKALPFYQQSRTDSGHGEEPAAPQNPRRLDEPSRSPESGGRQKKRRERNKPGQFLNSAGPDFHGGGGKGKVFAPLSYPARAARAGESYMQPKWR